MPASEPLEPADAPRWTLEVRYRAGEAARFPLPESDAAQSLESLLWFVPEGACELLEVEGGRLLQASAGSEVVLRLRFALPEVEAPALEPALAKRLASLPQEPEALLAAGAGAGLSLRLAHGLRWDPAGGEPSLVRWVEVASGGEWLAVGEGAARERTLRLGLQAPEGALDLSWTLSSADPAPPAPSR